MAFLIEHLRSDLAEAERVLRAARLARAGIDESETHVVTRADEAVRLARRNRDHARGRFDRAIALSGQASEIAPFHLNDAGGGT
ncbi:MAG: hypothetical protein ACRCUE_00165 [Bosea sp. (in: a-proteobacteria)]